ncbi:MAG: GNAT family N-acetyltransferase [Pseudomonadota bacterium]
MAELGAGFVSGFVPGLIGEIASLHARFYGAGWGFGRGFEASVATDVAAFAQRYDPARDRVLSAWRGGRLIGTVTMDGAPEEIPDEVEGAPMQLRWFIVAESAQGSGLGRRLMDAALRFSEEAGPRPVVLHTMAGLDRARALYEARGFRLIAEAEAVRMGERQMKQTFWRPTGDAPYEPSRSV